MSFRPQKLAANRTPPMKRLLKSLLTLSFGVLFAVLVACSSADLPTSQKVDQIAELLELQDGMTVADIGAGNGKYSRELSKHVGATGHVLATEVDEELIETIEQLIQDETLSNVTTVSGDDSSTGLPNACCDAALLRLVYHHFTDPAAMRASLSAALRPRGANQKPRLLVIDIKPQEDWSELPGVPKRSGHAHGLEPEELIEEMASDGFELLTRVDNWEDKPELYALVFH